jgi:hypothetical protein
MPLGNWDLEWLDLNSQRAYPLADDATKLDQSGAFALPDSFLVNLSLSTPWTLAVDGGRFYIQTVAVFPIGYSITIGYDDGTNQVAVATANIAKTAHVENKAYALSGLGSFGDCTGKVAIGVLDEIDRQPSGRWTFHPSGGKLDADCIRPTLRGVSSITVVNGADASAPIFGDAALVAGTNFRVSASGSDIRLDAIDGAGLTAACGGGSGSGVPIKTINGIGPDASKNFTLVPTTCISITPMASGLSLSNTCSQPCCGCPELEALTAEIAHINDEVATLQAFQSGLTAQVDAMSATVLSSRISPNNCITCP